MEKERLFISPSLKPLDNLHQIWERERFDSERFLDVYMWTRDVAEVDLRTSRMRRRRRRRRAFSRYPTLIQINQLKQ
jgi:hypothetical protein